MDLAEINLDIDAIGRWSWPVKGVAILIISFVVAGAWYYFDTRTQLDELDKAQSKELELRTKFATSHRLAANLDEYKKQLSEIEKIFGDMLTQLPDKTQVAELLVDVSQTGLASGLEIELFKPLTEVKKDFYAELPIDIRVVGIYARFGSFVSGLAALPRIVTIHGVRLKRPKSDAKSAAGDASLVMDAQVKTYRYLDEGEGGSDAKKKPAAVPPVTGGATK